MKIYKVDVGTYLDRWLDKTDEQRNEMFASLKKAWEISGGKGILACETPFSYDGSNGFGMDEFPSITADEKYLKELQNVEWYRHFGGVRLVGTPTEDFQDVDWQRGEQADTD